MKKVLIIALLIVGCDLLQEEDVYGCTDKDACNFNTDANIFDNTCIYAETCNYMTYASHHWNFSRWIHDYYKWYEYKEGNDDWNAIREVFINNSDSTTGCLQDPTQGHCYVDIWDHSHKVEFTYDGSIMSSSSEEFKEVFKDLCGNNNTWDTDCSNTVDEVENSLISKSVYVIKDHHFYEGIQKYNMYFAGWDDNDLVVVVTKEHGDKNVTSPNQITYRSLWVDYNKK